MYAMRERHMPALRYIALLLRALTQVVHVSYTYFLPWTSSCSCCVCNGKPRLRFPMRGPGFNSHCHPAYSLTSIGFPSLVRFTESRSPRNLAERGKISERAKILALACVSFAQTSLSPNINKS
ncbi:hypothetical protein F5B17DRAFT_380624 [Nemania serpens]|nr:hypothetical protein F5B17DRAFT_380624 [Nemania serpens]